MKNNNKVTSKSTTIIGEGVAFKGDFNGNGIVDVCGEFEGKIACESVSVRKSGVVKGTIIAKIVLINGVVEGTIHGNNVEIAENAQVLGDIYYDKLSVRNGGQVEGTCRKAPLEKSKPKNVQELPMNKRPDPKQNVNVAKTLV